MRYFTPEIFSEIRSELAMIWAAHRAHGLQGKMRLYSPSAQEGFKNRQTDFEFWFEPEEINQAVELIELHYNGDNPNNTQLLLDPVVYQVEFGEAPVAKGSGVSWCTILLPEGESLNQEGLDRLQGANIFASPLTLREGDGRNGIKALVFSKEILMPDVNQEGMEHPFVEGVKEILELAHQGDVQHAPYYLLSGMVYKTSLGDYQHDKFADVFGPSGIPAHKFIRSYMAKLDRLKEAVTCWNAYEHNHILYRRFGIDAANLERNLATLVDADATLKDIRTELVMALAANKRVGLEGQMRLYTLDSQEPMRALHQGKEHWFDASDAALDAAIQFLKLEYNGGNLPNTPLLLDPFVYDGQKNNLGTGIIWATALGLGTEKVSPESAERLRGIGAFVGDLQRGEKDGAGLKIFAFSDVALQASEDGSVSGSAELYTLANLDSPDYRNLYFLSDVEYLTTHGAFQHPHFRQAFTASDKKVTPENIGEHAVSLQRIKDAANCFEAYDRHHTLYRRFGVDVENLEQNLRYYNLCARDFELLDATGPTRATAEEQFEMIVDGWIPRGAITLLAATGGTGKSSLAHYLAVLASIDWREGEEAPLWLGSKINTERAKGISVYFSGEDGPAIVNERAKVFDPQGRSKRLMFQRTEFGYNDQGEPANLDEFLKRLEKMPDVPVMVIDPARKYLTGDEDNAEVVSEFFEAIEEFAIRKNTACVVVHHLAKGAKPKDTSEVLDCLRGSQVFIDRPRVVIGMLREGPYTIAGLAKNNIPPSLGMVQGERVFVRDPDSLQLLWLPGEEGIRRDSLTAEELEKLKQEAGV